MLINIFTSSFKSGQFVVKFCIRPTLQSMKNINCQDMLTYVGIPNLLRIDVQNLSRKSSVAEQLKKHVYSCP